MFGGAHRVRVEPARIICAGAPVCERGLREEHHARASGGTAVQALEACAKHSSRRNGVRAASTRTSPLSMKARYLEDFAPGQVFDGASRVRVEPARIKSFAAEFDPQAFHLDEKAANDTIFHGLVASGWHTAAITMRLLIESEIQPAGGLIGAGFDELRWPLPVRPGDELRVQSEILEVRHLKSRHDLGLIKVKTTTLNQHGEAVQVLIANLFVPRRPTAVPASTR